MSLIKRGGSGGNIPKPNKNYTPPKEEKEKDRLFREQLFKERKTQAKPENTPISINPNAIKDEIQKKDKSQTTAKVYKKDKEVLKRVAAYTDRSQPQVIEKALKVYIETLPEEIKEKIKFF